MSNLIALAHSIAHRCVHKPAFGLFPFHIPTLHNLLVQPRDSTLDTTHWTKIDVPSILSVLR